MSEPLKPLSINKLGIYGVMRENEVDSSLIPDGAVTDSVNFQFDRKGASTVRLGLTALGSTVLTARPSVGLFNAQSGTALAVFSNGSSATIYSFSSGAWAVSLDGGTASVAIRFVDFASYTIAINFMSNTYTSMRFWNAGSSRHWHASGSPINPQNMWGYSPQFGQVYKSRVYLFSDTTPGGSGAVASNKSRLFFSSVISSTGSITWTPASDWVDINPGDGEDGSGLKRYSLELLCFKPNYIYRFKTSGVDPDPLVKVGTRSNESIVEGKRGLYFHHDSGFYQYTGSYPTEISRPISDIVDSIPFSQYASIVGWNDNDHIYWSIGNVTVQESKEAVTIKNCVVRYTESSQVWTYYSYPSDLRRGMTYNNGSTLTRLVATDYGVVATQNSGNSDLGEPIKYRMRTKWYNFGSNITSKTIEELVGVCEKAQASELMYRTDENLEWKTIGELKRFINPFTNKKIKFHRIKFQVTGMSRNEPPVFLGIEVVKGLNEGLIKEPTL
jgi:hypothetical protein